MGGVAEMADRRDIQIIPDTSGTFVPDILGSSQDTGLMLLQRLWVMLFADHGSAYRGGRQSVELLSFLDGGNIPSDAVLNALLVPAAAAAVASLEDEDRALIDSFVCTGASGDIVGTLRLKDGTTINGKLAYV